MHFLIQHNEISKNPPILVFTAEKKVFFAG